MVKSLHRMSDRVDRAFVIRYTLLFLGMAGLVFFPFILSRRSLVNKVDGFSQYIVYLRYMGQYLRSAVRQLLHGSFRLPSYDFSIGMGDDIGQIVRFHPLDFLSVFVPASCTEALYAVILILRFFAAGLSFSFYAFSWNRMAHRELVTGRVCAVNVLSGAMVYVFGGFMLIRVVNHPIYAAPFIVLPMLLLGAEKVMHKEGCVLFVFSVFLGFWSNYYFMYIMSVALFVYMLVRFPAVYSTDRMRSFFLLLGKMTLLYLLGLAMSMITLYPMIRRYLASARLSDGAGAAELFIYSDKRRYIAWFLNLISPYQSSGNGTDLNYAVIVLPCLAVLFSLSWKKLRSLKILFLSCILILLVPGAGYVLAFFNRENSRWVFLLALCCAMAVVFTVDCFADLSGRQIFAAGISAIVFWILVLAQVFVSGSNIYNLAAAAELAVCLGIMLLPRVRRRGKETVRAFALLITCGSTVLNGFMTYASGFGNLTNRYVAAGKTEADYENVPRAVGMSLVDGDGSFFRVEGYNVKHGTENSAVYSDYNGTAEYNSILNAYMIDAMLSQDNRGLDAVTTMTGLDACPAALSLAHVRYYIVEEDETGCIPYGFSAEPVISGKGVNVYECGNMLSFGYSSSTFITRENYDALSPLERTMVPLDAVVVQSRSAGGQDPAKALRMAGLREISRADIQISAQEIHLPQSGKDCTVEEGIVHAKKRGTLTFSWNAKAGTDAWLFLPRLSGPGERSHIRMRTGSLRTDLSIRSREQLYYTGREEYLVHLGYRAADGEQRTKLQFRKKGDYDLSGACILYVPMEHYDEKISALNEQSLQNEVICDGHISGTVRFEEPRMLVLSVPQSEGWSVRADGRKLSPVQSGQPGTGLFTANVMYQGILLPAGEHTVELSYETPGSAAGYAAAVPALGIFLVFLIMERKKKRKRPEQKDG